MEKLVTEVGSYSRRINFRKITNIYFPSLAEQYYGNGHSLRSNPQSAWTTIV